LVVHSECSCFWHFIWTDLLRHPWTVGSGNPVDFDRLIEQMDDSLVHDADVARKLDEIVRSKFAVLRRLLLCALIYVHCCQYAADVEAAAAAAAVAFDEFDVDLALGPLAAFDEDLDGLGDMLA
jgi:hypothetical protein